MREGESNITCVRGFASFASSVFLFLPLFFSLLRLSPDPGAYQPTEILRAKILLRCAFSMYNTFYIIISCDEFIKINRCKKYLCKTLYYK